MKILYILLFIWAVVQIWKNFPYLLTTPPAQIQSQVLNQAAQLPKQALQLVQDTWSIIIKPNNNTCPTIKLRVVLFNQAKLSGHGCSYLNNKYGCYFVLQQDLLNYTGQQCLLKQFMVQ